MTNDQDHFISRQPSGIFLEKRSSVSFPEPDSSTFSTADSK